MGTVGLNGPLDCSFNLMNHILLVAKIQPRDEPVVLGRNKESQKLNDTVDSIILIGLPELDPIKPNGKMKHDIKDRVILQQSLDGPSVLLQTELEFPGVGVSITLKPGGFDE